MSIFMNDYYAKRTILVASVCCQIMQIFVLERSYKGGVEWWPPGSVPKQKGKLWLNPSFQVVL